MKPFSPSILSVPNHVFSSTFLSVEPHFHDLTQGNPMSQVLHCFWAGILQLCSLRYFPVRPQAVHWDVVSFPVSSPSVFRWALSAYTWLFFRDITSSTSPWGELADVAGGVQDMTYPMLKMPSFSWMDHTIIFTDFTENFSMELAHLQNMETTTLFAALFWDVLPYQLGQFLPANLSVP